MGQKNLKEIIFCMGGKKELEEITSKKYKYFKPEEISSIETKDHSIKQTFLEAILSEKRCYEWVKEDLYNQAEKLGADAVINFTSDIFNYRGGIIGGSVRGTPVKEKVNYSIDKKSG